MLLVVVVVAVARLRRLVVVGRTHDKSYILIVLFGLLTMFEATNIPDLDAKNVGQYLPRDLEYLMLVNILAKNI